MKIMKRDGTLEVLDKGKIKKAIIAAFKSQNYSYEDRIIEDMISNISFWEDMDVEDIQDQIEEILMDYDYPVVAKAYILYRDKHKQTRQFVDKKMAFINKYKESFNTADATIDDNSNVASKNIGILNAEIHKEDNKEISRGMVMSKLKELYPEFNAKQYIEDLNNHIIYKHDESSFAGAIAPYCCSITMYPFLTEGIKGIGGLSASPKNLDSFCGMYINLIFAAASQFAGAVATSEFLIYFDYFARKEWGDNYYEKANMIITSDICKRQKTIKSQIHQYFQQVIYSINQPAASRGMQSASK